MQTRSWAAVRQRYPLRDILGEDPASKRLNDAAPTFGGRYQSLVVFLIPKKSSGALVGPPSRKNFHSPIDEAILQVDRLLLSGTDGSVN